MYPLQDCCAPCPTIQVVNVPGGQGATGTNGADGTNGISAYTTTSADFVVPAIGSNVTVTVGTSLWMVVGQNIFIVGPGNFQVVSKPGPGGVVLKFLGYTGDVSPGATISSGAGVSPGGLEGVSVSTPISIANGGTGAATKAAAQTALGLGQNAIISSAAALTQVITNGFVQISTIDVTIPAAGTYALFGKCGIDMNGVTFASSRVITLKIRNVTQGIDLASQVMNTQVLTTTSFPTLSLSTPFVTSAPALNDHLQCLIMIDTVNSAGTLEVSAGSLEAIPLRYS